MQKIVCIKPCGFETTDKEIRVFDKDRVAFYVFNNVSRPFTRFNLPKGEFYTDNQFKRLKEPVKFKLDMPKFERDIPRPKRIRVVWGHNPNKATIILQKGLILMDNSWKEYPKFVRVYILYHEIGHYRFKTEKGADAYARVMMLKRGYNPSQIGMASRLTLSPKSAGRIHACFEALKKV